MKWRNCKLITWLESKVSVKSTDILLDTLADEALHSLFAVWGKRIQLPKSVAEDLRLSIFATLQEECRCDLTC
jgi:hypothetical protein